MVKSFNLLKKKHIMAQLSVTKARQFSVFKLSRTKGKTIFTHPDGTKAVSLTAAFDKIGIPRDEAKKIKPYLGTKVRAARTIPPATTSSQVNWHVHACLHIYCLFISVIMFTVTPPFTGVRSGITAIIDLQLGGHSQQKNHRRFELSQHLLCTGWRYPCYLRSNFGGRTRVF